jgi:hypothetical protein
MDMLIDPSEGEKDLLEEYVEKSKEHKEIRSRIYFESCRIFPLGEKSDPDRRQV